jgi:2'-5' RNA ligase
MPTSPTPTNVHVRAFFALTFDESSLLVVRRLRERLVSQIPGQKFIRPIADASLHVTLKFLGPVPETEIQDWTELLLTALPKSPLDVSLGHLVAFGSANHARVLAASLQESTGELERCVQALETGATRFGIAAEQRPFLPHVTLARLRVPQDVRAFLEGFTVAQGPIRFETLTLYESQPTPRGSAYVVRAAAALLEP